MSKFLKITAASALALAVAGPAVAGKFGLGREALPEEIAAWDLDVSPDGTGLPEGSGSVEDGELLFSDNCAVCHGEFAEGSGNWPKLAGGDGSLADKDPVKTVGSYWPYLSTTFDYVHRSMPFGNAQSLTADETYAIVAYILYSNDIVEDDFVLSKDNFLDVEMPNADGFIVDDRPETEYSIWRTEPCMENCKASVEITMHASVLDVTPDEAGDEAATEAAAATTEVAATATEEAPAMEEAPAEEVAALNADLVAAGEKVFKKCKSCHQVGDGAKNRTGPILNDVYGANAGHIDGFKYSNALKDAAAGGLVWNDETLAGFLASPKKYMKGTKMSFGGLRKDADIAAIIEFLKSVSQ